MKEIILTGIRSNDEPTLGNYLGAFLPMVDMANQHAGEYQINMFVPDLHSFTTPIEHQDLYDQTLRNIKLFVASGLPINHEDVYVYRQSFISAHSELAWILSCFVGFGEASRMVEFKDFDSLAINWRLFGDIIDDDNTSTSIRGKYLYHFENTDVLGDGNSHIKTISKNNSLLKFGTMSHYPVFKPGKVNKNVKGEVVTHAFSKPDHTKIWIDHYHLRGLDDYLLRKWVGLENNAHLLQTERTEQNVLDTYYYHRNLATQKIK